VGQPLEQRLIDGVQYQRGQYARQGIPRDEQRQQQARADDEGQDGQIAW